MQSLEEERMVLRKKFLPAELAATRALNMAESRFVACRDQARTDLEFWSMCNLDGLVLRDSDTAMREWIEAGNKVSTWIGDLRPHLVVASGRSAYSVLRAALPISRDTVHGIPVSIFNRSESFYFYEFAVERRGWADQEKSFFKTMQKIMAVNLKRLGISLAEKSRVIFIDDNASSGKKALYGKRTLEKFGYSVSFGALAGSYEESGFIDMVGSTDPNFFAFVQNLANGVSFYFGKRSVEYVGKHPRDRKQVDVTRKIIGRELARLKTIARDYRRK